MRENLSEVERDTLSEVERDTEEAYRHRRELAKLLVEKITVDRDEDGRAKVDITYRFGPPVGGDVLVGVHGIESSPLAEDSWSPPRGPR